MMAAAEGFFISPLPIHYKLFGKKKKFRCGQLLRPIFAFLPFFLRFEGGKEKQVSNQPTCGFAKISAFVGFRLISIFLSAYSRNCFRLLGFLFPSFFAAPWKKPPRECQRSLSPPPRQKKITSSPPPPFNISHRSQPQQEEKRKNTLFPPKRRKEEAKNGLSGSHRNPSSALRPHFFHPPPLQPNTKKQEETTHATNATTIALECRGRRRLFFLLPIPAHPFPSIHIHIALRQKNTSRVHFRTYTTFPDRKWFFRRMR